VLRLGCLGCLTVLVVVGCLVLVAWGVIQVTRAPDIAATATTAADGVRAQQKLFDLMRRAGRGKPHTVSFTEREVNAFLSRHLADAASLPLRNVAVRLPAEGHAEIAGQLPFRELIADTPVASLSRILPRAWLERGVWLWLRARVTLEGTERRHLRLDVERFTLGRLRLPAVMLRVLLDPTALRLLRWPMPDAVDGLRIEPGRLVIQAAA